MTAEQFAYWMQGFAELNSEPPTAGQWQSMKEHLATVFVKVTPQVNFPSPAFPRDLRDPNIAWPQLCREIQITCGSRANQISNWPNKWADRLPVGGR